MPVHSIDITGELISPPPWTGDGNPLWVDVRPNLRRIHVLAGDILAGLGKRRDVGGKGRNESEDVLLASAWLRAHRVGDLVVINAQLLDPRILLSLTKLAVSAGCDLWLLHRPPVSDTVQRALTRRADEVGSLDDVPVPVPAATDEPEDVEADPAVPHHDFHVFASAVQRETSPADARVVMAHYNAAAEPTAHRIATSTDAIPATADVLLEVIRAAPSDAHLIAQVRGVQVAAWHHDVHVSVDLPRLLNSEERPRVPVDAAGPTLLSYRQPYRAITWLLAAHHIGLDQIASAPIDTARPDGAVIGISGRKIQVDPSIRPAVRAQRALRLDAGASLEDPLLPYATKTLSYALTDATNDLGVTAHGRLAERQTLAPLPWLKKLGITIRELP